MMTSYQRLKNKCEKLQAQVDIFKNALTSYQTSSTPKVVCEDNGMNTYIEYAYSVYRNKLEEEYKKQLQYWVAENLDEETIMHLLKLKKEIPENDK